MKLKEILNEAADQWTVKDILALQKAHERILVDDVIINIKLCINL